MLLCVLLIAAYSRTCWLLSWFCYFTNSSTANPSSGWFTYQTSSLLLVNFVEELQRSLLLAFAEDAQSCKTISETKTAGELEDFLEGTIEYGTLLFVVDQFNALTVRQLPGTQDPLVPRRKLTQRVSSRAAVLEHNSSYELLASTMTTKHWWRRSRRINGCFAWIR